MEKEILQVRMLGGFSMVYQEKTLVFDRNYISKSTQLLQILFLHLEKGIAKERLLEELYGRDDVENRNGSLNNTIFRLRKQLEAAGLPEGKYFYLKKGIYYWDSVIPVETDLSVFEKKLEESRKEQIAAGKTPVYDGHCEHLTQEQIDQYKAEGRKPVVRLKVRKDGVFAFDDMVRGHVEFQASGIGDFIIVKSDGIPVYNFAVVIDDAKMGITHVIRAEEHLSNTPRQLAIYEALGYEVPKFGHISLILGADHKKMSKRHGATSVTEYRNMGYLPQAMFNYLALLGWAPQGEQEIFSVDELVKQFSMNRVSSNDAVFDIEKLNWINFQYMKQLTPDQLLELTLPFIEKAGYVQEPIDADKKEWLKAVVWYVRDHLYYGAQAPENVKVFFEDLPALQDPELLAVMKAETSALIIKSFAEELKKLESFDADSIKSCFTRLMKETKVKGKAAFEPVRIALTGVTHGPGLYDMIALFGKEKAVKLLEDALAYCSDN